MPTNWKWGFEVAVQMPVEERHHELAEDRVEQPEDKIRVALRQGRPNWQKSKRVAMHCASCHNCASFG